MHNNCGNKAVPPQRIAACRAELTRGVHLEDTLPCPTFCPNRALRLQGPRRRLRLILLHRHSRRQPPQAYRSSSSSAAAAGADKPGPSGHWIMTLSPPAEEFL
mmetsp:Transcript_100166/g.137983  ORF Transcript_100166/g.137983 Transcript_100166/m.137983 type:complete len:103 (-) Transcript_100166:120-428(-)